MTPPFLSLTNQTNHTNQAFEKGDPKADENVRSIISSTSVAGKGGPINSSHSQQQPAPSLLRGAVQACLSAALGAWDAERQQKYLQAAAYGAF